MTTFINNQRYADLAGVRYDSSDVIPGPIVYTRTHLVRPQLRELAKLPPCVLVTSFSDASVTDSMARRLPKNVLTWFSNNVETHNQRVRAIPIGVVLSQDVQRLLSERIGRAALPKKNLVYMNFFRKLSKRPNPRRGLYEMFGGEDWVTTEGGFDHVPLSHFYDQVMQHKYVLSPPGAGPDCHRHWESILLGAVPIVLKSRATDILDDLPCLRVNDWGEVNQSMLEERYELLAERFASPAMEKIWFEYWQAQIMEACHELD